MTNKGFGPPISRTWVTKWTIEINGSKGWEIVGEYPDTDEGEVQATDNFRHYCEDIDSQYRLTTPASNR